MPLACKLCIAKNGLKGTDLSSLPQTQEELFEHIESVHHNPVQRGDETMAAATERFLAKYPDAKTCEDCIRRRAPWACDDRTPDTIIRDNLPPTNIDGYYLPMLNSSPVGFCQGTEESTFVCVFSSMEKLERFTKAYGAVYTTVGRIFGKDAATGLMQDLKRNGVRLAIDAEQAENGRIRWMELHACETD